MEKEETLNKSSFWIPQSKEIAIVGKDGSRKRGIAALARDLDLLLLHSAAFLKT